MIQGVRSLRDSAFRVEGDRIVAGTYGAAVMAAGGDVTLKGVRPSALKLPLALFPDLEERLQFLKAADGFRRQGSAVKRGKDPDQQQRSCRASRS